MQVGSTSMNTATLLSLGGLGLVSAAPLSHEQSMPLLVSSDGTIGIKSGSMYASFCLRNKGGKVKLQACKNDKERFQWRTTKIASGHHIASAFDDTCWEANVDEQGAKIELATCDPQSMNQQFQFDYGNIMQVQSTEKYCVTLSKNMNLKMKRCVYNKFGAAENGMGGDMNGMDGMDGENDMDNMGDDENTMDDMETTEKAATENAATEKPATDAPMRELNNFSTDFPMTYDATSAATGSDGTAPFVQTQADVGRASAQCYELVDGFHFESVTTCCTGGNTDECYDNAACHTETGACACDAGFFMGWNEAHASYDCRHCAELYTEFMESGERFYPLADVKQKGGCEDFEPTTTYPIISTELIEEHMGGAQALEGAQMGLAPDGRMGKK